MVSNYRGRKLSAEPIRELTRCEVFVFGSNLEGKHRGGAAGYAILVQPMVRELGHKGNAMPFQPCLKQLERWFHTSKSLLNM